MTAQLEDREALIASLGTLTPEEAAFLPRSRFASPDPHHLFPRSPLTRHELLAALHRVMEPRTYLEVGVQSGASLALSRARTIAVDPAFAITSPVHCDLRTFREKSDDFFARPDAFDHFEGAPVDLAFLDGMHLSEYTLRDFISTEKRAAPGSLIVIDDVLPRNDLEASRVRRTEDWTGDVFKVFGVLQEHRPDLVLVLLNTAPTGTLLVAGLDPSSTVLEERYERIEAQLRSSDPQQVPAEMLSRRVAKDPTAVLSCDVWPRMAELRADAAAPTRFASTWAGLLDVEGYRGTEVEIEALRGERDLLAARLAEEQAKGSEALRVASAEVVRLRTELERVQAHAKHLDAARRDLRWLLKRLDRSPAGTALRRFEGFRTLKKRWL